MNIIIGFLSGVAASMGLGGGFILIIYLTIFQNVDQVAAQGINLLFFLPIALISLIIHWKNKLVDWRILPALAFSGAVGVLLGTWLATAISVDLLRKLFAALLIYVGMRELFHKNSSDKSDNNAKKIDENSPLPLDKFKKM